MSRPESSYLAMSIRALLLCSTLNCTSRLIPPVDEVNLGNRIRFDLFGFVNDRRWIQCPREIYVSVSFTCVKCGYILSE